MKKLKYEDRVQIEKLLKAGMNGMKIAKIIGVHYVTIYRELDRCGSDRSQYTADKAQQTV